MFRLPRNSYEFNTDPNKGIDYILSAIRAIQNTNVSQIIAGTNISISPVSGTGAVTINASGGGSIPTLDQVTTAGNTTANSISVGGATVGQAGGNGVINFPNTTSGFSASILSNYASNSLEMKVASTYVKTYGSGQILLNGATTITGVTGAAALLVQQGNAGWSPVADFNGSSGTALRVNTNGNILIGTTTDAGYKLDVNGTARVSGNLTVDTNTLFVDSVNNRVGIGTTTPSTLLEVVGSYAGVNDYLIPQLKFQNSNITPSAHLLAIARVLVGTGYVGGFPEIWIQAYRDASNNGTTSIRTTSNHPLNFWTNDIERLRIFANGNVGIGTITDAGYKLDVNGTSRFQGSVTNTSGGFIFTSTSPTSDAFYTLTSGAVGFYTSHAYTKAQRLNLTNTTGLPSTPNNVLLVSGSITSSSALAAGVFFNNTLVAAANNDVLVGLDIAPTFTNGAFTEVGNFAIRASGYSHFKSGINIISSDPVWSGGIPVQGALITFTGAAVNYYAGYQSGSGFFHKFWTNAQERVRIADGYTSIVSGNLLIGTTTDAGYKLDVNGTARFSDTLLATANASTHLGLIVQPNSQGNAVFRYLRTATTNFATFEFANGSVSSSVAKWGIGLRETNDNDFHFYNHTASKDQLVIKDNTGNVGIGTSSPSSKFHVNIASSADFMLGTSSALPAIIYPSGGYMIRWNNDGSEVYMGSSLWTVLKTQTNEVVIRPTFTYIPNYNVGIGTSTDAGYKLDVNGNVRTSGTINVDGNNGTGGQIFLKNSAGDYITQIGTSSYDLYLQTRGTGNVIKFRFGSSARELRFQGGGTGDIQVIGEGASWAASAIRDIRHGSDAITITSSNYNGGDGVVIDRGRSTVSTDPIISFKDYGVEKARINRAGNIGIGTTAPEGPLHVKYSSSTVPGITIENDGVGYNAGSMTLRSGTTGGVNMSATSNGGLYWFNLNTTSNTLSLPATGNLIVGGAVDAGYRLDVKGGNARFEQNVEAASYSVAGNAGYSGIINFPGNPPGQQNLEYLHGILINVF